MTKTLLIGRDGPSAVDGLLLRETVTPYEAFGRLLSLQEMLGPIAEAAHLSVGDGGIVADRGTDGVLRVRIPAPRSREHLHGLLLTIDTKPDQVVISPADELARGSFAGRPARSLEIRAPVHPVGHESARERTTRILVHAARSVDRCIDALSTSFRDGEAPRRIVDDEPEELLNYGADARAWALGILGRSGRAAGVTLPSPWSGSALVTDYRESLDTTDWTGACPRFALVESEPDFMGSTLHRTVTITDVHLRGMFEGDPIHPARNAMETIRATAMADEAMRRRGTGAASGAPYTR